ncbi:hypothetical protein Ddc_07275 [Ditylenchus destructor]|nr:hypothetical protein Ddc_07275 [Ditylenchus destructor]
MSALPYALLTDELEKQPKPITTEVERLEESYRALRTLQIQCKDRYVDLEDQIKSAGSNLQLQISDHQTKIVPSRRHHQNVQSFNQHLQDLQNLRPDFDAVSLELSDITSKVQVQLHKLNGMKLALGIKPEKSAQERIDELEKKKQWHQKRGKMGRVLWLIFVSLFLAMVAYGLLPLMWFISQRKEGRRHEFSNIEYVNEHPLLFLCFYVAILFGLGAFLVYLLNLRSTHKNMVSAIDMEIADINRNVVM